MTQEQGLRLEWRTAKELADNPANWLFNGFLQDKQTTQKMEGGNTKEFYEQEGTLPKSAMLVNLHPDVAKLVRKYHRDHHRVDYSGFRQPLRKVRGLDVQAGNDEYGMIHQDRVDGEWVPSAQ